MGPSWGPNTYQSCLVQPSNVTWSDHVYEVLNSTFNALLFNVGGPGGVYILRATVVDGSTSYCSLVCDFGVYVYGAPLGPGPKAGIMLGALAVFFIVLGISFHYKRQHETEKLKNDLVELNIINS